jgi:cytochrome P450
MALGAVRRSRGRGSPARPPGPPARQAFGALLAQRRPPHRFLAETVRAYGGLAHIRVAGEHAYIVGDADLVWLIFVTHGRDTMKGRALQRAKPLLGEGLLTSEGELHRRQRLLVQPAFHHTRIAQYAEQMAAAAEEHGEGWVDGRHVDLAEDLSALTLDIVGRTLFGADLKGDAREVGQALTEVIDGFRQQLLPGAALLDRLPLPSRRRTRGAIERLDAIVWRLIAEHRAAGDTGDVLSMLLQSREQGSGMSDRQVRDEVMTLVLAGHETTANALAWAFWHLSQRPDQASWLHAELDSLPHRRLGWGDLPALPRTRAVIAESLRLHPPAWTIGRRLLADLEVGPAAGGWLLPAGSICLASQWVLHRDPRYWAEAESFTPTRWLDADGSFSQRAPGQPRGAWFPFGLGSRVCIGEDFAWTEAVLVLATLARRWAPAVDPQWPEGEDPGVTLRPRGGLPATLQLR